MDCNIPMHGMFSQFVNSIIQRFDNLKPEQIQSLEANVLNLLITSLHVEKKKFLVTNPIKSEQYLYQIKEFINSNLNDYRLNPDFIAQNLGISKRYIHKVFKKESSSLCRYILKRRLEKSYNALINPELMQLTITEIAYNTGFGDMSNFNRCFKSHFKVTPRELRSCGQL